LIAEPEVAAAIDLRNGVQVRMDHGADLTVLRGVLTVLES
jgi:hypothetical protein